MKPILVTALALLSQITVHAAPSAKPAKDVSALLVPIVETNGVPGMAAVVVRNGETVALGVAGVRTRGKVDKIAVADRFHIGSDTKAMTGHADLVLGHVACRDIAQAETIRTWRTRMGVIAGPMEAWLAHRSLATLDVRLRANVAQSLELPGRIGYLELPGIVGTQADQDTYATGAQQAIRTIDAVPRCGWVVDLRTNRGGYIYPMLAAAGPLLGNGPVAGKIDAAGVTEQWVYSPGQLTIRRAAAPGPERGVGGGHGQLPSFLSGSLAIRKPRLGPESCGRCV